MLKKIGLCMLLLSTSVLAQDKTIIGPTAQMSVVEAKLAFVARIDTGAVNTSLNAFDLKVEGGGANQMEDDVGKILHFTTENAAGERQRLSVPIFRTSTVSNSQGRETRYMVWLHVGYAGKERKVLVNLRNRSDMDYKLLIGRSWLKGKYLVDVADKKVIGPVAPIYIVETGLMFKTRIDTGAVESSLHALDLKVKNGVDDMQANIGKMISFTTENEKGISHRVEAKIVETSWIRNAQGSEIRYMVELNVGEPGEEYKIKVNLRDRSKMRYKLLIGRNWLQDHYLVDVER
ncbi:putative ATP-dependent zinc protease [Shewanella violacea]|nr:RimK/LysX family protein [Shewanella violacea]